MDSSSSSISGVQARDTSPPRSAPSFTILGAARRLAAHLASFESVVLVAIAITSLAIVFRAPLTTKTMDLNLASAGRLFDSYAYDDSSSGGSSSAAMGPRDSLSWTCTLRPRFQWPYCGFGLLFDRSHEGRGIDLAGFNEIQLRIRYHGPAKLIRISLKDHDRRAPASSAGDKVNQATLPLADGDQLIPIKLQDFAVAEWWKEQAKATSDIARPSFGNVVAMEFITGNDGELGTHAFKIERIRFVAQVVSVEAWYGLLALGWAALILCLLVVRRRQLALVRQSAEGALRASEQLYRGILEATTDAIVLLSPEGNVELVNDAAVDAMELDSAEQVLGRHWTRLWRDESATSVAKALEHARGGRSARFRSSCATSKGTLKWWDVVVSPMCDGDGEIRGLLTMSRDVTNERKRSEELQWASEHDALTHLPNRRAFQERLKAAVLRAIETESSTALLLIDLDHFKHVNDSLGHGAGDTLLRGVADRLRSAFDGSQFIARIGGDEFAIVIEDVSSDEELLNLSARVRELIQLPVRIEGRDVRAGASIGGALFPRHAQSANDLFKSADTALYSLKHQGRGGTRLFDFYMLDEAQRSASQIRLARGAVTARTVVPVYQPQFRLEDGSIAGLEALLRWRHPRKGLQLPHTLEEAFGDYELAAKIGTLMQRRVARDVRGWIESGLDVGRVAINAAPAEFLRDNYAEMLLLMLEEFEVAPSRLEVEITEHAFFGRANEYVARALEVLKKAGVSIALDDFGTGYSSLSHLRDFPVDLVKIDMSFVQRMTEDHEIAAIVTAVVSLARSLGIEVVAEGVDKPEQLDLLRSIGCHMAQGHLFTRPVEAAAVAGLLSARKAAA
jgi:diguanylate cyclase (GGDEF)-like protein/PAS domain S-box-containing protein